MNYFFDLPIDIINIIKNKSYKLQFECVIEDINKLQIICFCKKNKTYEIAIIKNSDNPGYNINYYAQ